METTKTHVPLVTVIGTWYSKPFSPLPVSELTLLLVYFKIYISEQGYDVDYDALVMDCVTL